MLETKVPVSSAQRLWRGLAFVAVAVAGVLFLPKVFFSIVALGAIVFVHELGHFTVAKLSKIRIEVFSIGFGTPLFTFERGGTQYQIAAIPLGGFVKPAGEYEEKEGETHQRKPDEFLAKPWWVRGLVLVAGPLANFVFPVIALFVLYATLGRPLFIAPPLIQEVNDDSAAAAAGLKPRDQILKVDGEWAMNAEALGKMIDTASRKHPGVKTKLLVLRGSKRTEVQVLSRLDSQVGRYRLGVVISPGNPPLRSVVERVVPGTPAEQAGFQKGDEITSIAGKELKQGSEFDALFAKAKEIEHKGAQAVAIGLKRGDKALVLYPGQKQPIPDTWDPEKVGLVGLELELDAELGAGGQKRLQKMGLGRAAREAIYENVYAAAAMVEGIWQMVTGRVNFKQSVGGPVAIMRMAHQQADQGIFELLQFMLRISLILGIMNLLPIPLLDGGTLLLCVVEGLRGKPLPIKMQSVIQNIAAALLISLMVFATYNDIVNWVKAIGQ